MRETASFQKKVQKAKTYAAEPNRIHFRSLDVAFDDSHGEHDVEFRNGRWRCDCEYFRGHGVCSHTMALERVLGEMAPAEAANPTDAAAPGREPDAGIRGALASRVNRWITGSLERLSDDEVLKLVEAQSPAETVAELLVATPDSHASSASDWTELLLRGADAKSRVAALAGGLLSPSEAARTLKISVPGVKQRVVRQKLLAVPLPGGQRGFPALQFREDGGVRDGVPQVAAAGSRLDPWALLAILVDEVEDDRGGTLLERLADDAVRADVLARLASFGEHGAA